jgi:hypothetical protein
VTSVSIFRFGVFCCAPVEFYLGSEVVQTDETTSFGGMAQLVARLHGMQKVRGSNPLTSTKFRKPGNVRNDVSRFFAFPDIAGKTCQRRML